VDLEDSQFFETIRVSVKTERDASTNLQLLNGKSIIK
jgi:hypothetical protein